MSNEKTPPHHPPDDIEVAVAAALTLLKRISDQTDQIEPALKKLVEQGTHTNQLLKQILDKITVPP